MKKILILATLGLLVGCGGGGKRDRFDTPSVVKFASGPISRACMDSGRPARNRQLCGCIQSVANVALSSSDQSLAVTFFEDPHRAQEIRQSDKSGHERFWQRYKAFADMADANCKGFA
ncbi:MAG: hypothetical protein MK160_15040 [Rhodobacteraceae bacterium]|nr:hypothetical protein [Paracoccaceae bacterium]